MDCCRPDSGREVKRTIRQEIATNCIQGKAGSEKLLPVFSYMYEEKKFLYIAVKWGNLYFFTWYEKESALYFFVEYRSSRFSTYVARSA